MSNEKQGVSAILGEARADKQLGQFSLRLEMGRSISWPIWGFPVLRQTIIGEVRASPIPNLLLGSELLVGSHQQTSS